MKLTRDLSYNKIFAEQFGKTLQNPIQSKTSFWRKQYFVLEIIDRQFVLDDNIISSEISIVKQHTYYRIRSQGHRHYTSPKMLMSPQMIFYLSHKNLLGFITFELNYVLYFSLYYTPFTKHYCFCTYLIIIQTCSHRLFTPVCVKGQQIVQMLLIWLISSVTKTTRTNFHRISYSDTSPIATKVFNYCSTSKLKNSRLNHLTVLAKTLHSNMTLSVTQYGRFKHHRNESLRRVLSEGPKYRELRSIYWYY